MLTHVARSAESLGRLLEWAATGVEQGAVRQPPRRAPRPIQAGSRRTAGELVADIRATAQQLDDQVRDLPEPAWAVEVTPRTGEPCTPARLVMIRLRELEVHHVDLAAGYRFEDIPQWVSSWVVDDILATFARRGDALAVRLAATDTEAEFERTLGRNGPLVRGSVADLLGWLSGRSGGTGLEVDGGAALPAVPDWV